MVGKRHFVIKNIIFVAIAKPYAVIVKGYADCSDYNCTNLNFNYENPI